MRRALVSMMAVMLFAVGSSTAIAATPQTITIRALVAQAGWETYDETTGAGESGSVQFANADGASTVTLSMSKGELVLCQGGDTPEDPFDDVYGFVGTETYGEGTAKLSLGRTYSSARAWGSVTAQVFTFNECTGDEGVASGKTIAISLNLTGIAPVVHEKLHSTVSIPSRLRSKTVIKADSRAAAGSIKLGARTIQVDGVIGQLSLRDSLSER